MTAAPPPTSAGLSTPAPVVARVRPIAHRVALAPGRTSGYARRALTDAAALGAAETAALALALLVAGALRRWLLDEPTMVAGGAWLVLPLHLAAAALAGLLPGWGLGVVEELRRTTLTLVGVFALAVVLVWAASPDGLWGESSRLTLGLAGVLALGMVPFARAKAKSFLVEAGVWGVPVAVYGAGRAGALVVRQLQEEAGMGYAPVAVFDDDAGRWGDFLDTVPIVGGTERTTPDCSVAVLALPEASPERRLALLEGPLSCYRTVIIVPDLIEAPSLWVRPRDMAGLLGLEITSNLTRPLARWMKRGLDLAAIALAVPLWAPVVGLLAGLVWLEDRHNPFFLQERVGRHGRAFRVWKLRTMRPDADRVLAEALDADPARAAEWATTFKLERDPRITRVGRWVRAFSLDELPQLANVLAGEMSLVGPRPLPRYHHEELDARVRDLRERVRPGITGLWQVSGRSDTGTAGMERWDPYYVRNWSLWLDVVVLFRTVRAVLGRSGAY